MILSIDPGVNNCGLSVVNIESDFIVIETWLIKNARKFTDEEKIIEIKFGNRTVKVMAIVNKIKELLVIYPNIDRLIIEAPFYNALTPMAYSSLLEVIFSIKYTIIIPMNLDIKLIEPLLVKKLFSGNNMAKKEAMKQFLIKKKDDGNIKFTGNIEQLSEHEIDSIAIGYVYYLSVLEERSSCSNKYNYTLVST